MNLRHWLSHGKHKHTQIRRRTHFRRPRLTLEILESRQLLAILTNGSGPGQVSIDVNEQGAFGISDSLLTSNFAPLGDSLYTPPGFSAPVQAVFESGIAIGSPSFIGARDFITAGTIGDTGDNANGFFLGPDEQFPQSNTELHSRFFWPNDVARPSNPNFIPPNALLMFDLQQTLVDLLSYSSGAQDGTVLVQRYVVTNVSDVSLEFDLVRYFDGDLFSSEPSDPLLTPFEDGGGARVFNTRTGSVTVFQTDFASSSPADELSFIGIQTARGGASGVEDWEVGQVDGGVSDLLDHILAGNVLRNSVIPTFADANDDAIVDLGEESDIAVASSQLFFDVEPGDVVTFTTMTVFGHPPIDDGQLPPREQLGYVSGFKFIDANGNGIQDGNESGGAGFTIFADLNQNGVLDAEPSTVTDASGFYSLTLPLGVHQIREVVSSQFVQTSPPSGFHTAVIQSRGDVVSGLDFGNAPNTAALSGLKYDDVNGDGDRDSGEFGLSDVSIYLDLNDNNVLDFNEPTQLTNASGFYSFVNLAPGSYVVREFVEPGFVQTQPGGDGAYRVTLAPGQSRTNLNFGNTLAPSNLIFVGDGPVDVKYADLNGDGFGDVITANVGSDNISVALGGPNATFSPAAQYVAGDAPVNVAAADLDLDGDLDLIVALEREFLAAALINNGDGTFAQPQYIDVNERQHDAVVFDSTGDGRPDLHFTRVLVGDVVLLPNISLSPLLYGAPISFPVSSDPQANAPTTIKAADLDGDGDLDLAVSNFGPAGEVSLLTNNGSGDFGPSVNLSVGSELRDLVVADFDGDTDMDLAVVDSILDELIVIYNNVFPTTASFSLPTSSLGITAGDFNSDNATDIAVTLDANDSFVVFLNNGFGSFLLTEEVLAGDRPWAIVAAPIDGDGQDDLLVTNFLDNTVFVALSDNGGGGESPEGEMPEDVDGNGRVDISDLLDLVDVLRARQTQPVSVFSVAVSRMQRDVSGDGVISADDLLRVIQYLRGQRDALSEGEGEAEQLPWIAYDPKAARHPSVSSSNTFGEDKLVERTTIEAVPSMITAQAAVSPTVVDLQRDRGDVPAADDWDVILDLLAEDHVGLSDDDL